MNAFNQKHLTHYLNFHRPCFFPDIQIDQKGKARKISRYETMMTPYAKLESRPRAE